MARLKDLKAIIKAKRILESAFNMKDLSESKHLLGMAITQDSTGIITVQQEGYIEATLYKFSLKNCKAVSTPMEYGKKLVPATPDSERYNWKAYQQLIGKLMWAMLATRLDIAFVMGWLSQFNMDPTQEH